MKIVFCFIILFNSCYCIEDSKRSENDWGNLHTGIYRGNVNNYDDHKAYGDDQNPIIRPCPLHDLNCIRRVFSHNSKCTLVEGPAQDPYMLRRLDLPIPQANLTFSLLDAQVKGLNEWKIKTFFINKATDRLVLEVVFDRIVVASPGARTTFHRKGKEPIEETDYSIIEYLCYANGMPMTIPADVLLGGDSKSAINVGLNSERDVQLEMFCPTADTYYESIMIKDGLSFTLTISHIEDLQLSNAHIFTYVADANPLYTLGPAVRNNKDPGFIKAISVWLDNLGVTMQEVWTTQGPAFMTIFLQSTICDFTQL